MRDSANSMVSLPDEQKVAAEIQKLIEEGKSDEEMIKVIHGANKELLDNEKGDN